MERNNYSRYNLRLNLTNKISEKLTLTTRLSGVNEIVNEPAPPGGIEHSQMSDIINLAVRMPAVYVGRLSNGDWGTGHAQMGTPMSYLASESFYTDKPFSLNANMNLDWQAFSSLKFSLIGGYQRTSRYQKRFLASQRLNDNILLGPASVNQINNSTYYGTVQGLAEFDRTIEEHHVGVLAGYSFESNRFETLDGYRDKLPGNDLSEIDVGSPEGQQVEGTANEWAPQSFFGRSDMIMRKNTCLKVRCGTTAPPDFQPKIRTPDIIPPILPRTVIRVCVTPFCSTGICLEQFNILPIRIPLLHPISLVQESRPPKQIWDKQDDG